MPKPWYKVVSPREDPRDGRPLDASEFVVHLDDVRNKKPDRPDRFFARTYLTKNLSTLASQVVRRLSGERTETSAVFNLATQFGGGKCSTEDMFSPTTTAESTRSTSTTPRTQRFA